jgi:hypothetical protein
MSSDDDRYKIVSVEANGAVAPTNAENVLDDNPSTRMSVEGIGTALLAEISGNNVKVNSIWIKWYEGNKRTNDFEILASEDKQTYNQVFRGKSTGKTLDFEKYKIPETSAKYYKIVFKGNSINKWFSITELVISPLQGEIEEKILEPQGQLDENGVLMIFSSDPEGFSWSMKGDLNNDSNLKLDIDGRAEKVSDNTWAVKGRRGSLAGGREQLTCRLNIHGSNKSESFKNHEELRRREWMTDPILDIGDQETTIFYKLEGFKNMNETVAKKIRGGSHSSGNNAFKSACVGLLLTFNEGDDKLFEKELFHPRTPKIKVNKLFNYSNILDRWIGDKITSLRQPDGSVINTQYIDTDPFDLDGKPKNNWKKVFEYIDKGKDVVNWKGRYSTIRVDDNPEGQCKVTFKFFSVRSIKNISSSPPPTTTPRLGEELSSSSFSSPTEEEIFTESFDECMDDNN